LVVNDEPSILVFAAKLLRRLGHTPLTAASGREAIEAVRLHPGEVEKVLLDVVMPGMDGCEVARRLRTNPDLSGTTPCALTAYTPSKADRLRPQQAGFDHHIIKPVSMDMLAGLLKSLA
jgi:CheY-like chemotaxis protein